MKKAFPSAFYNTMTLAGLSLSGISFGLILFLMVLEWFDPHPKPYMGIIAFIILPAFLLLGIGLIVFGAIRERRRRRSGLEGHELPRIEREPAPRRALHAEVA